MPKHGTSYTQGSVVHGDVQKYQKMDIIYEKHGGMCWKFQKNPKIQMSIKCELCLLCDVITKRYQMLKIQIFIEDVGKDMGFEEIGPIRPNGIAVGVQDSKTGVKFD